jgi:hypothetical protein
MKRIRPLAAVALAVFALGCRKDWVPPAPRMVSVIVDYSDKHLTEWLGLDAEAIVGAMHLQEDMWQAVTFRLATIGATGYGRIAEEVLPAENVADGNALIRHRKIRAFEQRVIELIHESLRQAKDANTTVFHVPVTFELERLAQCPSCDRVLIIVSDALENHGKNRFSLYTDTLLDSLASHPAAFEEYCETQRKVPELKGIRIVLVARPMNSVNTERVQKAFNLWEGMWERHGATVEFTSNYLNN